MNLESKKKIDELVGKYLLIFLSFFYRLIRRKPKQRPASTILITKYQGLGSLALAKPAIRRLRQTFPEAHLIFLGTRETVELAKRMPEFDEILLLNDRSLITAFLSLVRILLHLWRKRVDWSFDLEVYSNLAAVISLLSFSRNQTGFMISTNPIRKKVYDHILIFNRFDYLGRAYWRLFGIIDRASFKNEDLIGYGDWKLQLTVNALKLPHEFGVVNIHAGALSAERKWPRSYYEMWAHTVLEANPIYI